MVSRWPAETGFWNGWCSRRCLEADHVSLTLSGDVFSKRITSCLPVIQEFCDRCTQADFFVPMWNPSELVGLLPHAEFFVRNK